MRSLLVLCALAAMALRPACAQVPEATPYLNVETGVHQSVVNRMALLPGGLAVATVSDDKTARVWTAGGLQPLGVIRPPIGPADDGQLFAVAASGNVLAVAGRIRSGAAQFGVQFHRLPDLKRVGQLPALPAPVSALRFSRDGRILLVGMVGIRGLAFYDVRSNGLQVGADIAYAGQVQWIDVDAHGLAVASGEDGRIRLYGPDHRKVADAALPGGGKAYAVAFSPDGRLIAAGDQNGSRIWLLDAATLRPVRSFTGAPGRAGGFAVVAFAPAGDALFGAGTYKAGASKPRLVRRWPLEGGQATEFEATNDTVMDLLPVGTDVLVAGADPVVMRLDATGRTTAKQAAHNIDFRDAGLSGFAVSHDGAAVRLPAGGRSGQVVFDVRSRTLTPASQAQAQAMAAPSDLGGGLRASDWRNAPAPRLNNVRVALEKGEVSLAAAVSPAARGAAFGTNFHIRFQRPDGTGWRTLVTAPAWAVNVSGDGRLVIAGLGDGTVRWYDAATGAELLSLFLETATRHWVLSTAAGYFDHDEAGPGEADGRTLIGYRFDEPAAQASRFVEVGQLYPTFYRPDLVSLALRERPAAGRDIQGASRGGATITKALDRGLPAIFELQQVCAGASGPGPSGCFPVEQRPASLDPQQPPAARQTTTADTLRVRFRLSNPGGDPGRAAIFRNAAAITPALATMDEDGHGRTQEAVIPLGSGENAITLRPVSASGEVEGSAASSIAFSVWRAAAPSAPDAPRAAGGRTLFMLSVGISRFDYPVLNLENASNDARAVAAAMSAPDSPIYDAADITTLYDEQATVETIDAALRAIAEKAQPDDLVVIYLAGHGKDVDGRFYFAPYDFGVRNPEVLLRALTDPVGGPAALDQVYRTEGLGPDRLLPHIQAIRAGHVAVVLDTCYSAALAVQDAVLQRDINKTVTNALGHATGRFVLSSATASAADSSKAAGHAAPDGQEHGLFTSYLLEALEGRADTLRSGRVDVVQLAQYTISKVKQATAKLDLKQEPAFFFAGSEFFALRTAKSRE